MNAACIRAVGTAWRCAQPNYSRCCGAARTAAAAAAVSPTHRHLRYWARLRKQKSLCRCQLKHPWFGPRGQQLRAAIKQRSSSEKWQQWVALSLQQAPACRCNHAPEENVPRERARTADEEGAAIDPSAARMPAAPAAAGSTAAGPTAEAASGSKTSGSGMCSIHSKRSAWRQGQGVVHDCNAEAKQCARTGGG